MEIFSALLATCAGNSPVTGEFPSQRPVSRSFDVFFDLWVNKWLSKRWWGWWFETPSRPLCRHCNEVTATHLKIVHPKIMATRRRAQLVRIYQWFDLIVSWLFSTTCLCFLTIYQVESFLFCLINGWFILENESFSWMNWLFVVMNHRFVSECLFHISV